MKNSCSQSFPRAVDSTACSSVPQDDASSIESASLCQELKAALAAVDSLKRENGKLRAALSETSQKRDLWQRERCALQERLRQAETDLDQCKQAAEVERMLISDKVRRILKKASSSLPVSSLLAETVSSTGELPDIPTADLVLKILSFSERLVSLVNTGEPQADYIARLSEETTARIRGMREVLNTPKRQADSLSATKSQERFVTRTLSKCYTPLKKLARSKTRVSICRPASDSRHSIDSVRSGICANV